MENRPKTGRNAELKPCLNCAERYIGCHGRNEDGSYPKLYQRERFDTFKNVMVKSQGWVTSPKTRPQMLATLHTVMDEEPGLVVSTWTLGEMITFVYDENRKPQAAAGEHDDLVMAAAIAHTARTQQRYTSESGSADRRHWTKDMWEDWRRADPAARKQLEAEWKRSEK